MLSIGELAARTGLSPATLRMWETRHAFPVSHRLASGHRRYDPDTVDRVRAVVRRQTAGVRLEAAIAEVGAQPHATPSVYAELRSRHPELTPWVLRKSTVLALTHAIEDECVARAEQGVLFGAFQRQRHLRAAQPRWEDLASTARATFMFAVGPNDSLDHSRITHVQLGEDAPMRREWSLVCDGTSFPVALSAWELPGQGPVPDPDRRFETVWTVDPVAVREASRVCAGIAAGVGVPAATELVGNLPALPHTDSAMMAAAGRMFARVVAYVDRKPAPPS